MRVSRTTLPRQSRSGGPARVLGAVLAVVVGIGLSLVPATAATAAPDSTGSTGSTGNVLTQTPLGVFDPGNIITDEVFFTTSSLTSGQIQSFLQGQLARCGATTGPACLKDYRQTTPDRAADEYCATYEGATNERASAIIGKVSAACGVSAKVLLVLLQKEQSLVTSSAPTERQYRSATGFACPDTAPCDERYYGFFNQVYAAARQYKRYAVVDTYNWFPVGATTEVLYNPDRSCGTQAVTIANSATAGLYYYTPYTPNAAALANLDGRGDLDAGGKKCSSFGNRNFWRIFTQWFGSTQISVTGSVQVAWLANGGLGGTYGKQKSAKVCSTDGRYCVQTFAGGTLASNKSAGFGLPKGALRTAWTSQGSQKGALGWPKKAQSCLSDGTCVQSFTGGYAATSATTGTRTVLGGLAKAWYAAKGRSGVLGMPKANASCNAARTSCTQKFQGGSATQSTKYGNRVVVGKIHTVWNKDGRTKGSLGWPAKNQKCKKVKGGTACYQYFSKGAVTSHPQHGTRKIAGKVGQRWSAMQKAGTPMGYAKSNRSCSTKKKVTTCRQSFTGGTVVSRTGKATVVVRGAFATTWNRSSNAKKLGLPTSDKSCRKSKGVTTCTQKFAKGTITQKGKGSPKVVLNRR